MNPTDYEDIAREAAIAEERRRLAARELRAAILRGEAAKWSDYERADAYNVCSSEIAQVPAVQDEHDCWFWEQARAALREIAGGKR